MSRWRFAWAWFVAATLSLPALAQWAPATAGWQVAGVVSPVGSGVSGLTSGRVTLSTGATTVGDDAGCTWTGTGASFALTIGILSAGSGSVVAGYTAASGDYGLHLASAAKLGFSSTLSAGGAPDLAISRASAGTLLVEDGSGNARDVQARTGTFGTSVVTPLVEGPSVVQLKRTITGGSWYMGTDDALYPAIGNTQDLGYPGTNVVRTGYFGTSVVTPVVLSSDSVLRLQTVGGTERVNIGAGYLQVDGSGAQLYLGSSTLTESSGAIASSGPVRLKGYTVATLPAGTVGDTAYVTDATAPTYLGALTGGGAVTTPVFYNGAAWVSH